MKWYYLRRTSGVSSAIVSIAVLGIVVFLLMVLIIRPTCGCKAREKARLASCMSNEKQLGLAVVQYTQDYDEHMPLCNWTSSNHSAEWQNSLWPYTKSTSLLRCPDDSTPQMDPDDPTNTDGGRRSISSYVYNSYLGADVRHLHGAHPTHALPSRDLGSIEDAQRTLLIAEGHGEPGVGRITAAEGRDYQGQLSLWCGQYVFPAPWHSDAGVLDGAGQKGKANCGLPRHWRDDDPGWHGGSVVFVDGHAKAIRYHDAASVQAALPFYPSVTGIDAEQAPTQPPQEWSAQEMSPGCQ